MAGSLTDTMENTILDHVFRNQAYTPPTTCYLALFTVAPTDSTGGTECTGTSYARQAIAFDAASGGAIQNTSQIDFPAAGAADWGTIVAAGIMSLVSAGTLMVWFDLTASKTPGAGDVIRFAAGAVDITLD